MCTQVEGADEVVQWILQHCSNPLLPDARSALSAGEALTFGPIRIDREGVTVEGSTARWKELRCVSVLSGRLAFFRRWPRVPWRTVGLEKVPHPTVHTQLDSERAPSMETERFL